MKLKLILTGGGTGGHILPNLALVPYLRAKFDIYYIGSSNSMESELVPRYGIPFYSVPCIKFSRGISFKNFGIPLTLSNGISRAKQIMDDIKPDFVFGKGGYVALPVIKAASKLKIPYAIHESDMSMGLSNRLVASKAAFVCGSFADSVSKLNNGIHTGAPIRNALYGGKADKARQELGISAAKPILLVMGGSSGALALNTYLLQGLDRLTKKFVVIHLTGKGKATAPTIRNAYYPLEFVSNIENLYALADLCVTRGGAGALFEVAALRVPSLIIPLPKSRSSRGDQVSNARRFAELGYSMVLPQENLTADRLISDIELLSNRAGNLRLNMQSARNIDGSQKIVELIMGAVKK